MRRYIKKDRIILLTALVVILLLTGCVVGPKYARPTVETPLAYKETPQAAARESESWRASQPKDATNRGQWWKAFNDPQLDELEAKASSSNQEIVAAATNFLAARALVREARAQYFPTLTTNPTITNERPSPAQFGGLQAGSAMGVPLSVKSYTNYTLPFDASWEPDFWGRIRNGVRSSIYAAQASAADLENVRLSEQAELAADYYELRGQDSLKEVLDSTGKRLPGSFQSYCDPVQGGPRQRGTGGASRGSVESSAGTGHESGHLASGV